MGNSKSKQRERERQVRELRERREEKEKRERELRERREEREERKRQKKREIADKYKKVVVQINKFIKRYYKDNSLVKIYDIMVDENYTGIYDCQITFRSTRPTLVIGNLKHGLLTEGRIRASKIEYEGKITPNGMLEGNIKCTIRLGKYPKCRRITYIGEFVNGDPVNDFICGSYSGQVKYLNKYSKYLVKDGYWSNNQNNISIKKYKNDDLLLIIDHYQYGRVKYEGTGPDNKLKWFGKYYDTSGKEYFGYFAQDPREQVILINGYIDETTVLTDRSVLTKNNVMEKDFRQFIINLHVKNMTEVHAYLEDITPPSYTSIVEIT